MRLYTVYRRRKGLAEKEGIPILDVSTNSGMAILTPYRSDVELLDMGNITDEEYIQRYRAKLRKHYRENISFWRSLAHTKAIAIMCERAEGPLANRFHVRDQLFTACKELKIPFEKLHGELYAATPLRKPKNHLEDIVL